MANTTAHLKIVLKELHRQIKFEAVLQAETIFIQLRIILDLYIWFMKQDIEENICRLSKKLIHRNMYYFECHQTEWRFPAKLMRTDLRKNSNELSFFILIIDLW